MGILEKPVINDHRVVKLVVLPSPIKWCRLQRSLEVVERRTLSLFAKCSIGASPR